MLNGVKIGLHFKFGTKFIRFYSFEWRSSNPCTIFLISMFNLFWVPNFIKIGLIVTKSTQVFNFGWRYAISNIILMIKKLDQLWVTNFIELEIYFIFGTKFCWNEGINTCFNFECVLLGRNFHLLGGYLVVTAHHWWILLFAARYCSFPHLVWMGKRLC